MPPSIVFDFDGVLADSEPLHFRALGELLATLGLGLTEHDYYTKYLGYDDVGVFGMIGEEQGWAVDEGRIASLVARKSAIFQRLIATTDVLYGNAAACVERLAAEFPLGIASGALRHEIEAILARGGLARHFRFIVASGDTPASKPAPDPYRRAAELHGTPPSACVAIEDTRWGIESARSAGLRAIGVTTTCPAPELSAADRIVSSLDEIHPTLIRSLF
jgi:beta-phosphoglucomutase-like phosphatase (HAD superfamily)